MFKPATVYQNGTAYDAAPRTERSERIDILVTEPGKGSRWLLGFRMAKGRLQDKAERLPKPVRESLSDQLTGCA